MKIYKLIRKKLLYALLETILFDKNLYIYNLRE